MKIVIVGGHFTPALAVIEKLSKEDVVFYIGRKHSLTGDKAYSLEYTTLKEKDVNFIPLKTGKLNRTLSPGLILEILKVPLGIFKSIAILHKVKPDVVFSLGSYVSLPVALAALILRIPLVVHEQTQEAGLSNKIESLWAKKVCISHETSRKYFPKGKTVLTGNPIRSSINDESSSVLEFEENLPIIFITGGSQGSHKINELILEIIPELAKGANIIHQTGDSRYGDYEMLLRRKSELGSLGKRYKVFKFLKPEEMGPVMKKSTLVVGRAGANTVNELEFLKKPALLLPLAIAQKDEQAKNAIYLKNLGLAEVVYENNLLGKDFLSEILKMLSNIALYRVKEEAGDKDPAQSIVTVLTNAANHKKTE